MQINSVTYNARGQMLEVKRGGANLNTTTYTYEDVSNTLHQGVGLPVLNRGFLRSITTTNSAGASRFED
jgi:hypothetical protein